MRPIGHDRRGQADDADEPEPVDGGDRAGAARRRPRSCARTCRGRGRAGTPAPSPPGGGAGRGRRTTRPRCAAARRAPPRRGATRGASPTTRRPARRSGRGRGSAPSRARSCARTGRVARAKSTGGRSSSTRRTGVGEADRPRRATCPRTPTRPATRGRRARCRCGGPRAIARIARGELDLPRVGALGLGTGEHTEQQVEVVGAARDRAEHVDVDVGRAAADVRQVAALRDHAEARLQAERRRSSATGCAPSRRCRCRARSW